MATLYLSAMIPARAQTNKADSLANLIRTEKIDTSRIMLIYERNKYISLDSAIYYNLRNVETAQKIKFYRGEVLARHALAGNYINKSEFSLAKEQLQYLRQFLKPSKDSASLAELYSTYGRFYGTQSKYDSSIQYFDSAIRISERHQLSDLGSYYSGISIGYQQLGNYPAALDYQQKGLNFVEKTGNQNSQAYILLNMAITYENIGDTAKAQRNYLHALELALKLGMKNVETYSYSNLANLYLSQLKWQEAYDIAMKSVEHSGSDKGIRAAGYSKAATALTRLGRFPEAYQIAQKAIETADSTNLPLNISQAYRSMGDFYYRQKKYKEAIPYYLRSKNATKDLSSYSAGVATEYKNLAECYEQTGDYFNALQSFKRSAEISDSVTRKENIRRTTELSMNFEFEKRQNEMAEETQKAAMMARTRQYILTGGLISVLILGLISFIGYKGKQRANKKLSEQKRQIEYALSELKSTQAQLIQSEKMASLGELTAGIAHEIQNPLNFVNNFSEVSNELMTEMEEELTAGNWESAKEIATDVKQNLEKINVHGKRAGAIVRGMLQHSRGSSGKKELTDINALCDEYIRLSYHGLRAKDKSFNAHIETQFDESIGNVNIVSQDIGRVILNLLNNAFYAVNKKQTDTKKDDHFKPTVTVITRHENGNVEVIVKDNGSGISGESIDKIFQPFFTTKPTGKGTGLGLSLAYDIIKAHGGELKVESVEGAGTSFTIQLPLV